MAFPDELSMTSVLTRTSPIAIPDYSFVARDKSFGGYRVIPGKELTVARFNRLTSAERHAALKALAGFLNALHGLGRAALPAYRAKEPWSGTDLRAHRDRYWNEQRALLAPYAGKETIEMLDRFYETYSLLLCKHTAVIHGDLTDDHILLDPVRRRVSGVIDFADTAIGDPAQDFSFLWSYGDWAPACAYANYDARRDGGLLERSRRHYLRYATHRIVYCLQHSKAQAAASTLKRLRRQLKAVV